MALKAAYLATGLDSVKGCSLDDRNVAALIAEVGSDDRDAGKPLCFVDV